MHCRINCLCMLHFLLEFYHFIILSYGEFDYFLQQKLAKRDGGPIDRKFDVELLWKFYQQYKRRYRVDDIQREEQKLLETGAYSVNIGEYGC